MPSSHQTPGFLPCLLLDSCVTVGKSLSLSDSLVASWVKWGSWLPIGVVAREKE